MYEGITSVGERGQITLPKAVRTAKGIKSKDKVIVKIEDEKITVEKAMSRKEKDKLMEEGYKKLAAIGLSIEDEMKYTSKESDRFLDDY
ncbi:MAG: AbrB/MazE/SpoVT family DNA-binding domain-containing protein [Candidatus Diapherotrites archaeon]|uniref:AbrB/MazE/SpoVT family DNA-binding domain-containing protein n=1 Tax=Candidatus Iainarchaeum sp. TaxID=3101447 RepID=A0A8T3YLI7_9ARCH|nr:AbrB/MazE/SpoVT family DNA-binding domain-containing protein [Candidatus Diapherotrites archaeon]